MGGSNAQSTVTQQQEQEADDPTSVHQESPPEDTREPTPWDQLDFPLLPHTQLSCRWRDGTMRLARIVERRPVKGGGEDEWEYYVHFRGVDRRMDCWKTLEDFDKNSVIPPKLLDAVDPK